MQKRELRKLGKILSVGDFLILSTIIYLEDWLIMKDRRFYEIVLAIYEKIRLQV